jgi:hypothetical protein
MRRGFAKVMKPKSRQYKSLSMSCAVAIQKARAFQDFSRFWPQNLWFHATTLNLLRQKAAFPGKPAQNSAEPRATAFDPCCALQVLCWFRRETWRHFICTEGGCAVVLLTSSKLPHIRWNE